MTTVDRKMTVTAWAAELGISRQAGHRAVRRCGIVVTDGMVDADIATLIYRQRTRPRVRTKEPAAAAPEASHAGDHISYPEAKRRQAVADMLHAETELRRQAGELVWLKDVADEYTKFLITAREGFMQLPGRLVPLLVADPTPAAMDLLLRDAIGDVLRALAQHPMVPNAQSEGAPPCPT